MTPAPRGRASPSWGHSCSPRAGPRHAAPRRGPDRVVRLALRADRPLVLLAPERVAALSTLSRDPALSHVARRAAALPQMRADAAAVPRPRPRPGLVLAGRHGAQATVAPLERRGVFVPRLDPLDASDAATRPAPGAPKHRNRECTRTAAPTRPTP